MGARSRGREAALQMLFAHEATADDVDEVVGNYWRELPGDPDSRDFADAVVRAVIAATDKIDERISAASRQHHGDAARWWLYLIHVLPWDV